MLTRQVYYRPPFASCHLHATACLHTQCAHVKNNCCCRESRDEDVLQIQQLSSLVTSQANELQASKDKLQQMRAELLLREDNYNKTFSNGGAGRRTLAVDRALTTQTQVVDLMLKSGPRKKIMDEKPRSYRMTK